VPSEAVNEATRRQWRDLGFFYDRDDAAKSWRIVGTAEVSGNSPASSPHTPQSRSTKPYLSTSTLARTCILRLVLGANRRLPITG